MDSHGIRGLGIAIAAIASMVLTLVIALPAGDGACDVVSQTWAGLNWLTSAPLLQPIALLAHGC